MIWINKNLIIGVIVLAVVGVGAALLFKSAPSQTLAPATQTQVTSAPTEAVSVPEATGSAVSSDVKEFTVTGANYKFDPKTITVKKGDKVKITLKSTGGFHNFIIDELNVKTPIVETGKSVTVEFTADKIGKFEYYCSVGNHRAMGMVGTLTVE